MDPWCPICGRWWCWREISAYERTVIELFPTYRREVIPVARFQCRETGRTFSLLPCELAPYHLYTLESMIRLLLVVARSTRGVATTVIDKAPESDVGPWLVACWIRAFVVGLGRARHVLRRQYELDRTGRPTMEAVQLTTTGTAVTNGSTYYGPVLLPAGDEFILLWLDNRTGLYQVYLTRLTVHGEKLIDDVQITEHSEDVDGGLTAAWTGSEVGIIWKTTSHEPPMRATIRMSTVTPDGSPVGGVEVLSTDARYSETPVILWSLGEYGVFFTKVLRDPLHSDLIFSRRHVDGTERTTETIYSTDPEWQIEEMKCIWTSSEYALMWSEFEDGNGRFFIQRISLTGEFIDPRIPLPDVFGGPEWLDIAYTGREFGFTWVEREFDIGDEQRVHTFFNRVGFCP